MKKTFQYIAIALLGAGLVACESMKLGDAGLSKAPETSGATIDTLFASLKDADKVLASAYYYLPYGLISDFDSKMGGDFLESITDHYVSNKHSDSDGPNNLYYSGGLSANLTGSYAGGETYRFGSEKDYTAIRYAWLFLENADRIPNADPAELAKKKAEAKLCMAIAYSNMLRYLGGVPILDHAVDPAEEMHYPRNTFAETVDFIVKLCDEAAPDLPWAVSAAEDGRMTRAGALGLKLRVLCFAASPTFNSNTKWHPQADEYTCYGNYDPARWQAAKAAADEFMRQQLANGHYALCEAQPDPVTGLISPRAYRLAYRKGYFERGSSESIISIRKSNSTIHPQVQQHQLPRQALRGAGLLRQRRHPDLGEQVPVGRRRAVPGGFPLGGQGLLARASVLQAGSARHAQGQRRHLHRDPRPPSVREHRRARRHLA